MEFTRKKWIRYLFQALGILLFIVILTRVDLKRIVDSYRNIGTPHVIAAVGIVLLFTLAKSTRWKIIVALQGVHVTVPRALTVYASSLYLGPVTPGRIGDFAKNLYLVNSDMKPGKAVSSSVVDRMFDLIFLAVIGYMSLLLFPGIFRNQFVLSSFILGLVILVTLAVFWRRDILERSIKGFASGLAPSRVRSSLDRLVTDVLDDFELIKARGAAEIALLTNEGSHNRRQRNHSSGCDDRRGLHDRCGFGRDKGYSSLLHCRRESGQGCKEPIEEFVEETKNKND